MSLQQFSLESLRHLDGGRAMEAFALHIQRASLDCMDRPGDAKPRKIKLEIGLVPVLDDDGSCSEVKAQIHATSTVPAHKTKVYSFGLRRNGMLVFNADSPDDVNQTTLLSDDEV